MLNFPIIDTHLHLWDPSLFRYAWLDEIPRLNRAHLLADYDRDRGQVEVESMVFLQCEAEFTQNQQEVAWVSGFAREDSRIGAIVSWAPLEQGERARTEIEQLADNRLVRGIRRIIQFEPDPAFCLQPEFIAGVQILADFDLHFEICLKGNEQFRNAITLVEKCPQVRFLLDHIGKPFIDEGTLEPWKSLLAQLSALPNTWCKMSGLVTEADHETWTQTQLQPYIDSVMESFGWERTMFGGDWPVVRLASEYPRWVDTLTAALSGAAEDDLRKVFRDNAVAFYRL